MRPRVAVVAVLAALVGLIGTGLAATSAVGRGADAGAGRLLGYAPRPDGSTTIRYRSIGVHGDVVEESAVLWRPTGPPSGDVVAWGHATTGLGEHCGPTSESSPDVPGLARLRAAGHVVVAPDYEGIGGPGVHPYLVGESAGRSVLDAIRAARTFTGSTGRSAVYGWSQGGQAAVFAAQLAPDYAPEARLVGAAAIAPVTDMAHLVDGQSVFSRFPAFVTMVVAGYRAAYPELDPTAVLGERSAPALKIAERGCVVEVLPRLAEQPTYPADASWRRRLAENDAGNRPVRVPLLLAHGEADGLLPLADTIAAYDRLCARGATVRFLRFASADHATVLTTGLGDVLGWLDDRLVDPRQTGCRDVRVL